MNIYTVQRQDQFEHDFPCDLITNIGCYTTMSKALKAAKREYERMHDEYENEMLKYSDKDICDRDKYGSGVLHVEADDECGYYAIIFCSEEHCAIHCVWVNEWKLED